MLLAFLLLSTLVASQDCTDSPNWGCELIDNPDYCNPLQKKKCLKACDMCVDQSGEVEEESEEPECAETFDPVCSLCKGDCDGMMYQIETRGEGQKGKFGCTYPKNYEFVNAGDNCPEPEKASCEGLDCAGCLAVPDAGCGFAVSKGEGKCWEAGTEPMDATAFAFSTADCEKMEASEESPEEEELPECSCGIGAVKGEEKFQSGSEDGTKMCEFGGKNCAAFFEGCADKGALVCSLKIEYEEPESPEEEELPECSCGLNAVKGEEKFQSGSEDGTKMCEFGGKNCAAFFEGCADKGALVCSLKVEYVEDEQPPAPKGCTKELKQCPDGSMVGRDFMNNCEFPDCPEMPSEESEESEEPETCSVDDCVKPCRGRGRKRQCQVKKSSKCGDMVARGRRNRKRFFSKLACASKSQTFVYEPEQAAWTTEDIAIYGFAAVGLVALARGALVFGKQLRGGQYTPVEFDSEL